MARCGCASDVCSCVLVEGDGIDIAGSGSANNPYVISLAGVAVTIIGQDTLTVQMNVRGNGSTDNPYIISANTIGGGGGGTGIADSGWVVITPAGDWEPYNSGWSVPAVRRVNGIVLMSGLFRAPVPVPTNSVVCVLPPGFRPSTVDASPIMVTGNATWLSMGQTGGAAAHTHNLPSVGVRLRIAPDGTVSVDQPFLAPAGVGSHLSISGISFVSDWLDNPDQDAITWNQVDPSWLWDTVPPAATWDEPGDLAIPQGA